MKKLLLWAVAASLLVAVVVTVASALQPPTYEASALVLVDVGPPAQERGKGPPRPVLLAGKGEARPIPLAPEPETLRGLAHTRAAIIDSPPVAEEAIRRSGLDMTPGMLLTNLAVEPVGAAQFLRLSYTDTDPERAREIVNTVGRVAAERITGTRSEMLPPDTELIATVWEPATLPDASLSPKPLTNGLIALVVALAISAAALIEARRRVRLDEEQER